MNVRIVSAAVLFGLAAVVAAPAPKSKTDPLPPPTAEQFQASKKNLRQIALAWHNFESANAQFPGNVEEGKGKPLLSWRVQILPFIEEDALYKQFKLDEPWDSETNKKLIDKMPKVYAPVRGKADAGMTYYQAFTGKHGLLRPGQRVTFASVTDGLSNTFMCVEAAKPVTWTKPDDLTFDGEDVPPLGGLFDGRFNVAMCDGAVFRFRKGVDTGVLKLLIDPADGNVIPDLKDYYDHEEEKK